MPDRGRRAEALDVGAAAVPSRVTGGTTARGTSARPLFVTAAGVDAATAAGWVRVMHGVHRVPTLLTRADRLCRDAMG